MSLIKSLEWRYATKRFNPEKKVSDADIETLKQAANLTASSYGLQPYRLLVINNDELQEQLKTGAYNQPQLTEASHVFVLASKTDMTPEYVDGFIKMLADQRGISVDDVQGYADYIKGSIAPKDEEFIKDWNRRQAYIVLGTLLAAAAELRIDACPMEGFQSAVFDEMLGLGELGLTAAVILPVGYRSEEDETRNYAKVRLPLDEFVVEPVSASV